MAIIFPVKKSEKRCGISGDAMDDGKGEAFDLPRRVFVMLKSCLDVVLASILAL